MPENMVTWECHKHGKLHESNAWVDEKDRVICGRCGLPAYTSTAGHYTTVLRSKDE